MISQLVEAGFVLFLGLNCFLSPAKAKAGVGLRLAKNWIKALHLLDAM